jgi:excisionase family DNA binding protein
MSHRGKWPEVLTIRDAARFLRLPVKQVFELAERGELPARKIGDEWRFLHSALADWLKGGHSSRQHLLRWSGAFREDETLAGLRSSIYAERGRPEIESME